MSTPMQERIQPSDEQITQARILLKAIPSVGLDWQSDAGRKFLDYVDELVRGQVPIAWVADALELDVNRLYTILNRYRRSKR